MNNKDLQIGDIIYRPDCYDRVVEIRSNGIIGLDANRGLIPFSELKPIQLTKEILEKNGFENIPYAGIDCNEIWLLHEMAYYGKSFPLNTDDIMLRCSISEQCWLIFFNIGGIHSDFRTITNIYYVHELQHLLRLCKIDKKIEL